MITLLRGDIVLFRGSGWVSRAIRWFERYPGNPARYNHAAIVVRMKDLTSAGIVEATSPTVRYTTLSRYHGTDVVIYRARHLSEEDGKRLADYALSMRSTHYNYGMIGLQAVDGLLSKLFRRKIRLAQRLSTKAFGSICSAVVAECYWHVKRWTFGQPYLHVDPDEMDDYCRTHPLKYKVVFDGTL